MEQFFVDYLERLETLHADLARTMAGLTVPALNWTPGPEMNPLCVLGIHVAGAERFWIGDMALGEPSGRNRDAEFQAGDLTAHQLIQVLDGSLDYARGALPRLTLDDLGRPTRAAHGDRHFTVGWCLAHALEHTGLHLGHAQLTRQLWEQRMEPQP